MIFKVTSTCLGYILIVKGAHRLFLGTELLSSIIILSSNIIGYTLAGIKGIGIAFLISYICYFIVVGSICRYKFNIKFNKEVIRLFFFTMTTSIVSFITIYYGIPINPWAGYTFCSLLILINCVFSLRRLWLHIK